MSEAATMYVQEMADGGWRVAESRVSLDSVVCAYWEGKSPEAIAEEFPTLSIEQVYGAIAFYLGHRQEVDRYLANQEAVWQRLAAQSNSQHGPLLDRLRNCARPRAGESAPP